MADGNLECHQNHLELRGYEVVKAARAAKRNALDSTPHAPEQILECSTNYLRVIDRFLSTCQIALSTDDALASIADQGYLYGIYKGTEVKLIPPNLNLDEGGRMKQPSPKLALKFGNQADLDELRGVMIDATAGGLSII